MLSFTSTRRPKPFRKYRSSIGATGAVMEGDDMPAGSAAAGVATGTDVRGFAGAGLAAGRTSFTRAILPGPRRRRGLPLRVAVDPPQAGASGALPIRPKRADRAVPP